MLLQVARLALAVLVVPALVACGASSQDGGSASQDSEETAAPSSASLANFIAVRPGLYRGGHPDGAGLDYLKSVGVKRIVNLEVADFVEALPWDITRELEAAPRRGMTALR
jgi:hypothetical protein